MVLTRSKSRSCISVIYRSNVRKPLGVLTRKASWRQERMSEDIPLPTGWSFSANGSLHTDTSFAYFIAYDGSRLSLNDAKKEIHGYFKGLKNDKLVSGYHMHIYSE